MWEKHIIGDFEAFFERSKTFLFPNCPELSEGQFWGHKTTGIPADRGIPGVNDHKIVQYYVLRQRLQTTYNTVLQRLLDWAFG